MGVESERQSTVWIGCFRCTPSSWLVSVLKCTEIWSLRSIESYFQHGLQYSLSHQRPSPLGCDVLQRPGNLNSSIFNKHKKRFKKQVICSPAACQVGNFSSPPFPSTLACHIYTPPSQAWTKRERPEFAQHSRYVRTYVNLNLGLFGETSV